MDMAAVGADKGDKAVAAAKAKDTSAREEEKTAGKAMREKDDTGSQGNPLIVQVAPSENFQNAVMSALAQIRGVLSLHDLDSMLSAYRLKNAGTYM
jgi:hypothetical protein